MVLTRETKDVCFADSHFCEIDIRETYVAGYINNLTCGWVLLKKVNSNVNNLYYIDMLIFMNEGIMVCSKVKQGAYRQLRARRGLTL